MRVLSILALLLVVLPASAGDWEAVTTQLLQTEKAGYGGLSGVLVDHQTGDLFICVSDRGVFQSKDHGAKWERVGEPFKGRTEWPGCFMLDPVGKGKRTVIATVYGAPIGLRTQGEEKWTFLNNKCTHVDWCAVDWTDPDMKFILALKHESGGLLLASRDGGKSFDELGKGFGPAWIFDGKTAVVAELKTKDKPKPGILRTTDAGKTWKPCSEASAQALPKWRDGVLYWLVEGGLLSSTDKGEKWERICDLKDGRYGPIFGKDAKQMFVLTNAGIIETTDGGKTWSKPIAIPKEMKGVSPLTWMEYDPQGDVLYVMKMTSELYRMERKK
jgi:photosystem II stability/assembly factor-like uncharacterized protein